MLIASDIGAELFDAFQKRGGARVLQQTVIARVTHRGGHGPGAEFRAGRGPRLQGGDTLLAVGLGIDDEADEQFGHLAALGLFRPQGPRERQMRGGAIAQAARVPEQAGVLPQGQRAEEQGCLLVSPGVKRMRL